MKSLEEAFGLESPRGAATPEDLKSYLIERANFHGVDPRLAASIFEQESSSGRNAGTSSAGARGPMQVMPATFRQMYPEGDINDPRHNVEAGIRYLKHGRDTLGTDDPRLLAAGYYQGYNRDSLKRGEIVDTNPDPRHPSVQRYADEVTGRVAQAPQVPRMKSLEEALGLEESSVFPIHKGEPQKTAPTPEKRNAFAYVNDFMIDAGNAVAGLAKAGVDFAAPGSGASQAIDEFIKQGQAAQSDWKKASREKLNQDLKAAPDEWSKAGIYLSHAVVDDPLGLVAEAGGNIGPFAVFGKALQAARIAEPVAEKIAMGLASMLSVGEVRGNIYDKIQATPDVELQRVNPEYAAARQSMTEAEAKKEFGTRFVEHLPELAVTAVVGALGGKYGLEAMAAGVGPRVGRAGRAVIGAADEGLQGAEEQLATNVGAARVDPRQTLTEDVGLNTAMEGLVGGVGGAMTGAQGRLPAQAPGAPQGADRPTAETAERSPAAVTAVPAGAPAAPVDAGPGSGIPASAEDLLPGNAAATSAAPAQPQTWTEKGAQYRVVPVDEMLWHKYIRPDSQAKVDSFEEYRQRYPTITHMRLKSTDGGQTWKPSRAPFIGSEEKLLASRPPETPVMEAPEEVPKAEEVAPEVTAIAAEPAPNPEQRPASPEAESQAPVVASGESQGDAGVAPGQAAEAPDRFDPGNLTPGSPEYERAYENWAGARQSSKDAANSVRRREENKAAVEKRNGWRARFREWFLRAKDGDSITDTGTEASWKVIEKTRKDGTKTKALVVVDENGNQILGAPTGIGLVGDRVDGLEDGGIEEESGSAYLETQPQSLAAGLGKLMEEGEAVTRSVTETGPRDEDQPKSTVRDESQGQNPPSEDARSDLDAAAHAAATSPTNDLPEPTPPQKEAGNYQKGHIRIAGLDISIENPQGSKRSGVDRGGKPWESEMQHHYGYIRGTVGKDKDHIDVFVKPGTPEDYDGPVFVVDQQDPGTHEFDEHKVMLGFDSLEEAKAAYRSNYAQDWRGMQAIGTLPMAEFKAWLKEGDTTKPLAPVSGPKKEEPAKAPRKDKAPPTPKWVTALGINVGDQFLFKQEFDYVNAGDVMRVTEFSADSVRIWNDTKNAGTFLKRWQMEKAIRDGIAIQSAAPKEEGASTDAPAAKPRRNPNETSGSAADHRKKFLDAIRAMGGIDISHALDISGEKPFRANQLAPGLFKKSGRGVDEIAHRLYELGYITEAQYQEVDGGVQVARDLVRQALNKEAVYTLQELDEEAERQFEQRLLSEADDLITPDELRELLEEAPPDTTTQEVEALLDDVDLLGLVDGPEDPDWDAMIEDARANAARGAKNADDSENKTGARDSVGEETVGDPAQAERQREPGEDDPESAPEIAPGNETDDIATPPSGGVSASEGLELTGQTEDEARADAERIQAANRREERARSESERSAQRERERKEIEARLDISSENFALGQTPEQVRDSFAGQGDLLGANPPSDSDEKKRALDDLNDALGDLGEIFGKGFRKNITPEQEQKLLPVLTRVFDAAFRAGYYSFKDAAKFVLDRIRAALGSGVADELTDEHLQGAYIAMSGRHKVTGRVTPAATVVATSKEEIDASGGSAGLERDRKNAETQDGMGAEDVPDDDRADARGAREGGSGTAQGGGRAGGDRELSRDEAPPPGEHGNQPLFAPGEQAGPSRRDARSDDAVGGGSADLFGKTPETVATTALADAATKSPDLERFSQQQREANKIPVKFGDRANVDATLPILLEGQREDVAFAEARWSKPGGYGVLFTNGTGTGKTFLALGAIRRFVSMGRGQIMVVVPSQQLAEDWISSGQRLGLDIKSLTSTEDAGRDVCITTYANFGENRRLCDRAYDLVVFDEAHTLKTGEQNVDTSYLRALRAVSKHPEGDIVRAQMIHRDVYDDLLNTRRELHRMLKIVTDDMMDAVYTAHVRDLEKLKRREAELGRRWEAAQEEVKEDVSNSQGERRPRVLFLSATPFAYEPNVDWAQGFLFEYEQPARRGYNEPASGFEKFMMDHFGWRKRTGRLTQPDVNVDRDLMQRQFNTWLRKSGALSRRALDVPFDYDRKFVAVDSLVGQKIDKGMEWLRNAENGRYFHLYSIGAEKFDYLNRARLLEAIKARDAVPYIRKHHALGRKVVVFYDFNEGGGFNIFKFQKASVDQEIAYSVRTEDGKWEERTVSFNESIDEFNREWPDLADLNTAAPSPLQTLMNEFPSAMQYNGKVPTKQRLENLRLFNSDDHPAANLLLVQKNANAGWSGHDTTGRHQRVLINLGLPTAPVVAIQQEGRIFRVGQKSDAIMRYLNTGTVWERLAFAMKLARRAGTAENLASGEEARGLNEAFIQAFEAADADEPGPSDGKGGKAADLALVRAITPYDRAKALYYAQAKKTSRNKAQEGIDYFATPEPLGLKMVEWADVRPEDSLLEPSGGHGAIARWFPQKQARTAIEQSSELASRLALATDAKLIIGSFENYNTVNKHDVVVMNPPFGVGGKKAMEHVEKAAMHLNDGGRIVALIPTGPAADKRLEKFLHGTKMVPSKPLGEHPSLGPIYRGDRITSNIDPRPGRVSETRPGGVYFVPDGARSGLWTSVEGITKIEAGEKRTVEVSLSEHLYMVANIRLPAATFERAGTSVAARIIILEKQVDAGLAARIQQVERDYSDAEGINEFFTRIEDASVPARVRPTKVAQRPVEPSTTAAETGSRGDDKKIPLSGREFVTHVTGKGKSLRGIVVTDMPLAEIKKIDPFTFRKGDGYFVRDRHVAVQEDPSFSRSGEDDIAFATDVLQELASVDEVFRYPVSGGTTIQEVIADIDPSVTFEGDATREDEKEESSADTRWMFKTAKGSVVYLYQRGQEVWIDVGRLARGEGGSAFYAAAMNYAYNTRRVFVGDPQGLTADAVVRRTYNMLSSALRFGTTRHMRAAQEQERGIPGSGIRPLRWSERDEVANLRALADTFVSNLHTTYPALSGYRYDFSKRQFVDGRGRHVTGERFLAGSKSGDARKALAGGGSLRAGILIESLVRSEGSQRPGILESFLRGSRELVRRGGLGGMFSRDAKRGPAPAGLRAFRHMRVRDVEAAIAPIRAVGRGLPTVHVVQRVTDLPRELVKHIRADGSIVRGVFYHGQIYLIADNLGSPAETVFTMLHEAAHFGLKSVFGAEIDAVLMKIYRDNETVRRAADRRRARYPSLSQVKAVEEVLADWAGKNVEPSILQRLVAWVRDWFRRRGVQLQMTNADVLAIIARARGAWQRPSASRWTHVYSAPRQSQHSPIYYSQLAKAVAQAKFDQAPASQWGSWLSANMAKLGVKADEIEWSGIREWLAMQDGKVGKSALFDYLAHGGVRVEETVYGSVAESEALRIIREAGYDVEEDRTTESAWLVDANGESVDLDDDEVPETVRDALLRLAKEESGTPTKFSEYTLPGGENYREVLLTLPERPMSIEATEAQRAYFEFMDRMAREYGQDWRSKAPIEDRLTAAHLEDAAKRSRPMDSVNPDGMVSVRQDRANFRSKHWAKPNVVAHIRVNDRTDADGKRVLFVEEIQSDWAQEGRKNGFTDAEPEDFKVEVKRVGSWHPQFPDEGDKWRVTVDGQDRGYIQASDENEARYKASANERNRRDTSGTVPAAPFVTKTESWVALALKRVLRMAAEGGYDRVAFITGAQSAERYDLSKQISALNVWKMPDGRVGLIAKRQGEIVMQRTVAESQLPDIVGKDLAERISKQPVDVSRDYTGLDLRVGGQGMLTFYDQIVPGVLSDVLRKVGGGSIMTKVSFDDGGRGWTVQYEDGGRANENMTEREAREKEEDDGGGAKAVRIEPQSHLGIEITPQIRERVMGGLPLFSAQPSSAEDFAASTLSLLSDIEDLYQQPKSDKKTLTEIAAEIDPGIKVLEMGSTAWNLDGMAIITMPDGVQAMIRTYKDGAVDIDASLFVEGVTRGTAAYNLAATYAHNNGWMFIGDPAGLTDAGLFRRTENMISSAMKFETTDHLYPHERQVAEGLQWEDGKDNLANLLKFSRELLAREMPEAADLVYDVDAREFRNERTGENLDEAAFRDLARESRGARAARAGEATLKRAALLNTLVRATSPEARRSILGQVVRQLREGLDPALVGTFYSRKSPPGSRPASAAPSQAPQQAGLDVSGLRQRAQNFLDRAKMEVDPFAFVPDRKALETMRYQLLGRIARFDEIAADIKTIFSTASEEDQQAAYRYFLTPGADKAMIPNPSVAAMAERTKALIESVGDALVARGAMTPEVREAHRGRYLPQVYLKFLLGDQNWKALGAGKKISDRGYLKQRKLDRRVGDDGEVHVYDAQTGDVLDQEFLDAVLGPVEDPGYLSSLAIVRPMRDMAILDYLAAIAENAQWVLPKSVIEWRGKRVSAHWAKVEAERLRRQSRHQSEPDAGNARKIAEELDVLADEALGEIEGEHADYRQIPNTARYGRLRGIWVRKEIYDDLMGVNDFLPADPGWAMSLLGYGGIGTRLTSLWKAGKVSLNPPAQVRNFVSNMVLLQLSGVPLRRIPTLFVRAFRQIMLYNEYRRGGRALSPEERSRVRHYLVALKYGVTESTFNAQELYRMQRDILEIERASGLLGTWGKIKLAVGAVMDYASDKYQLTEALGKTMKIMDEMERGQPEHEAALAAQEALFDYSLVSKNVRYLRNAPMGMPFLTFAVKVAPLLLKTARHHPERYLPWIALAYGLPALLAAAFDVDDDDIEALKKALPEWLQERGHAYVLPWKDDTGRWQVIDMGYFFPWTTWTEPIRMAAEGEAGKTVQALGLFSGPLTDLITAVMTGRDSFTGREIVAPGDPPKRQLLQIINYLWTMAMPPIITEHGAAGHAVRAATGQTDRFGDPLSTSGQAALRAVGVNVYPIHPETSRATNVRRMMREIADTEYALRKRLQDRGLSDEGKADLVKEYIAEVDRRRQKLMDYIEQSEVHPNLATETLQ